MSSGKEMHPMTAKGGNNDRLEEEEPTVELNSLESLGKLKVVELKQLLTEKGLSTVGKKEELVQRLFDHSQQEEQQEQKGEDQLLSIDQLTNKSSGESGKLGRKFDQLDELKQPSKKLAISNQPPVKNTTQAGSNKPWKNTISLPTVLPSYADLPSTNTVDSDASSNDESIVQMSATQEDGGKVLKIPGKSIGALEITNEQEFLERARERQKRFGVVMESSLLSQIEQDERVRMRKEKFK